MISKKLGKNSNKGDNYGIRYPGLPYMLEKNYFNEAFILHTESVGRKHLNEIILHLMQDDSYNNSEIIKEFQRMHDNYDDSGQLNTDDRSRVDNKWASIRNLFKFQPLWQVRDYFGELIAMYFSFVGILITTLWIPLILGVAFYSVGFIHR